MSQRSKLVALAAAAGLLAAGVIVVLVARGGSDDSGSGTAVAGCEQAGQPETKRANLPAPKQTVRRGEKLTAVVDTSCGTFEIDLHTERAPKTVNSFVYLAREGFYDGLGFHRIAPGFVIQGGDPLGDGTGGPGYSVDEKPPPNLAYTEGTVAMAKSTAEPPGRSGSQFFVVTGADAGLPPTYALVGRVSKGMNAVERIDSLGTPAQQPKQTVLIDKITIEQG